MKQGAGFLKSGKQVRVIYRPLRGRERFNKEEHAQELNELVAKFLLGAGRAASMASTSKLSVTLNPIKE